MTRFNTWFPTSKWANFGRFNISASTGLPDTVTVTGYATTGDLGTGAPYTSAGATAYSVGAIQSADGTWHRLVTSEGPLNLGWLGLIGDGTTDNFNTLNAIQQITPRLSISSAQTVTVTVASPAVFTLNSHGFLQGTPLVFSTTGTLPTGLTAGVPYWVTAAGLTVNTFSVSSVAPPALGPDQTRINTSGSQSGTHSVYSYGGDWVDLYLPPGDYVSPGGISNPFTSNGIKKARLTAYGARTNNLWWNGQNVLDMATGSYGTSNTALINSVSTSFNTNSVTVITLADATRFFVGQWALIMALDLQGTGSFPPNNHYFEFKKITAINTGTGEISFNQILRNTYKDTYPVYGAGGPGVFPSGGAAMIAGMHPYWDKDTEIYGVHVTETGQMYANCRRLKITDCSFIEGQGNIPTFHKEYIAENCTFSTTQQFEFDKLVEYACLKSCTAGTILIPSTSIDRVVFDDCDFSLLDGTAKLTEVKNSNIGGISIGPLGGLGASEAVTLENSRIVTLFPNQSPYADNTQLAHLNLVERWTWSGGTMSRPLTDGPYGWAVPGSKHFIRPFDQSADNAGSPFAVYDVRTDGVNTIIDTTLASKPVGNSTNSVVTITIASPAVVTWNAHGLAANTSIALITTGALPTGLSEAAVYYVSATGLTANTFQLSATAGGPSINTSGSQSGTQTAVSNPLQVLQHPCPRLTVINCTGSPTITAMADTPGPMFSSFKRLYIRNGAGPAGAGIAQITQPYVWGNLISMSVNVVRAYGGATNPFTLSLTAKAFDASLIRSDLSLTIDLRTTGLRTITPTSATGSVGVDVIASFANWISGSINVVTNADNFSSTDYPIYEIEVVTDQGITAYNIIQTFGLYAGGSIQQLITDTNVPTAN